MKKFTLLLILLTVFLGACATDEKTSSIETDNQRVSTIPWNKPEKWEGQGQLGGLGGLGQ